VTAFLYRGPLSSCNYGCDYCPFAKTSNTRAELHDDATKLQRFVDWIVSSKRGTLDKRNSVFFTPWGEALIRPAYQRALQELTNSPSVEVAAIQTNLSCELGWADACNPEKLGIWATYHDEWCKRSSFLDKVAALHDRGVRISVGVVGFRRFAAEIEALRADLPPNVYLWINAAKSSETYDEELIHHFETIDPNFRTNTQYHPSAGRPCRTGQSVVSVDGDGNVRRCHFVDTVLGNLYDDLAPLLAERACPNQTCGCHIGYVHMPALGLDEVYGAGILERVPRTHQALRRAALATVS
tara:strand:+ start:41541 stop:42431 length:891 start_codon:yes stop_codon:yes gene_type:complete